MPIRCDQSEIIESYEMATKEISHNVDEILHIAMEADISHITLLNIITKRLQDAYLQKGSTLPKQPVLYCAKYGGFGLSDEFLLFIGISFHSSKSGLRRFDDFYDRQCFDQIIAFGNFIISKFPGQNYQNLKDQKWQPVYDECGNEIQDIPESPLWDVVSQELKTDDFRWQHWQIDRSQTCSEYLSVGLLMAAGESCKLAVEWVPPLIHYEIQEYDGMETVAWS